MINVKEQTISEIQEKLLTMNTGLNKIAYLESALKQNFSYDIQRFLWQKITDCYEERKMFEKAAKAMSAKSAIEITFKDKIESCLKSAELYTKAGKIDFAEELFQRASREANSQEKAKIKLTKKNLYLLEAQGLEKQGKRVTALKFYEHLIKTDLDDFEKQEIKAKLLDAYKALGKFREAKLLEGL